MPAFSTHKELIDRHRDVVNGYQGTNDALMLRNGRDAFYVEGLHWCAVNGSSLTRLHDSLSPDTAGIRATANRTTRNIHKSIAQTYPTKLDLHVDPPKRDTSPEAAHKADVMEDATLAFAMASGFIPARRVVNARRGMIGNYMLGLGLESFQRSVGGRERDDARMRCFHAAPAEFWLDPAKDEPDLCQHEEVWWCGVRSAEWIERNYGVTLDRERLKKIGDLTTKERGLYKLSGGRLFEQYKSNSPTKGARVWQGHVRGDDGHFSEMYILIEAQNDGQNKDMIWANEEDIESPFGGNGLPFAKYDATPRPSGPWSISDTGLIINDQDIVNLTTTLQLRWLIRSAGFQILADEAGLTNPGDKTEFQNQVRNRLGGAIFWNSKNRPRAHAPTILQYPQVPAHLPEIAARHTAQMEQQLSLSEMNLGRTKSHVPDSTVQRLLEEVGEVKATRIKNDVEADATFLTMMLGTGIRMAKDRAPSILGLLRNCGFEPDDLAVVLNSESADPGVELRVGEGTVRNRPPEVRRQELRAAATDGLVNPIEVRLSNAIDLDAPLTNDDGFMAEQAQKAARDVLRGQEWQPLPLGEYTAFYLRAFRLALMSREAKRDESARQRIVDAIELQNAMGVQEQIAANPELAAQGQPAEQQPPAAPPEAMTIGDVLAAAGVS